MVALAGDIVFNSVILIDWKYGECLVMDCKIIDKSVRSGSEPITLVHFDEHVALFEIIRPFT